MQIVIPMAGESRRFKDAGYKIPKFLLKVNNKTIIEHVIDLFPNEKNFLFICSKKDLNNKKLNLRKLLKKKCPNSKIFSINSHKLGPVYSVFKILNDLKSNEPVIINYCDFNCFWDYKKFKETSKKFDGNIVVYKDFHPSTINNFYYAYIKESNGYVKDIREKKPFTKKPVHEYTSSGTYYFKNKEILEEFTKKTLSSNFKINGEYYVSMIYKLMLMEEKKISFYKIDYFSQWGTPEDFKEYENWTNKFEKINNFEKKKKIGGTLLIPAAGKGKRFVKEKYKEHKPLIKINKKPMIIESALTHPNHKKIKVVVSRKNNSSKKIKFYIKKYFSNSKIKILNDYTNGQATTCLYGIKDEYLEEPLTIGSCDSGLIYKQKKFLSLFNQKNTDIIVWVTRHHNEAIRNPFQFGWVKSKGNVINKISVKKPLNNPNKDPIVLGTFTFKKAQFFIESVNKLIKRKAKINNEYYVDSCINDAIKLGYNCKIFEVDAYLPWGTPNDLKTFKYWQQYFNLWKTHPYKTKK